MINSLTEAMRVRAQCQDGDANCENCPYEAGNHSCVEHALDDLVCAYQQLHNSEAAETDAPADLEKKKAQLWDAIFPVILQYTGDGDCNTYLRALHDAYMCSTRYSDPLVCAMSKLLIKAARSNVFSHDTKIASELVKILVAEVFDNIEAQKEEE